MNSLADMLSKNKVMFWKHFPIIDQNKDKLIEATLDFQNSIECDIIKLPFPGTWQAVSYHATDEIWQDDIFGRRKISKPVIHDINDWLCLSNFSNDEPELLKSMCEVCRDVKSHYQTKEVWATLFNPISIAIQLAGLETFIKHCTDSPKKVKTGLDQILENTLSSIQKFKQYEADGIYFVSQYMDHESLPSDIYKAFGVYGDDITLNVCSHFKSCLFHLHGSNVDPIIGNIPSSVLIHFENSNYNLSNFINISNLHQNLIPGIPIKQLETISHEHEISEYISQLKNSFPTMNLFTAACVLPTDLSNDKLTKWTKIIKKH